MSKRYGRNQKRRHREQIEQLTVRLEEATDLIVSKADEVRSLQDRIRRWSARIERSLGRYHPLHEQVRKLVLQYEPEDYVRVDATPMQPFSLSDALETPPRSVAFSSHIIDLVVHRIDIKPVDFLDPCPRAVVTLTSRADDSVYFAIDPQMLHEGRQDSSFKLWMAEEIVNRFSELLGERAPKRSKRREMAESHFE